MECKYKFTFKGQEYFLKTDEEFDKWLIINKEEVRQHCGTSNAELSFEIFSLDPKEATLKKIQDAATDVSKIKYTVERYANDMDEVERVKKISDSIGVSRLINKEELITPLNVENWKKKEIENSVSDTISIEKAKERLDKIEKSWEFPTEAGNQIHNALDSFVKYYGVFKENRKRKNGGATKLNVEQLINFAKNSDNDDNLISDQYKSLANQFITFVSIVEGAHGKDCIMIGESAFKSKFMTDFAVKNLGQSGITSINGRADLIIIDENGRANIYDWKVSEKLPGTWSEMSNQDIAASGQKDGVKYYHSTKKGTINRQLGFYAAILKQYNIPIDRIKVIPIRTKINKDIDFQNQTLEGVEMQQPTDITSTVLTGSAEKDISKYLSNSFAPLEAADGLERTEALVKKMFSNMEKVADFSIRRAVKDVKFFKNHKSFVERRNKSNEEAFGDNKFRFFSKGVDKSYVYCKDEEDLDEKLTRYVERLNASRDNELSSFGSEVRNLVKGKINLDAFGENYSISQRTFLRTQFARFNDNGWEFVENDILNQAGLFIFQKNGKLEIIMMSNQPLMESFDMGLSHAILGQWLTETKWNDREVLRATEGNIAIFKALAYVSENISDFKNMKITSISAMNPWEEKVVVSNNKTLLNNWDQMMKHIKEPNNLSFEIFETNENAAISKALDIIESAHLSTGSFDLTQNMQSIEQSVKDLENYIESFKKNNIALFDEKRMNADDPAWQALSYLNEAMLGLRGIKLHVEQDFGDYFNGNVTKMSGNRVSSVQTAPSANLRELGDLMHVYVTEVREVFNKRMFKPLVAIDAFYKSTESVSFLGGEADRFLDWFADRERLILKRPTDPYFADKPAARKALEAILDGWAKVRYTDEYKEEEAKADGTYYQVPLMQAKIKRRAKNMPFRAFLKSIWVEWKNLHEGVFGSKGDVEEKQRHIDQGRSVYNRFEMQDNSQEARDALLAEYGSGFFETDLEAVFAESIFSYSQTEVSRKYVPTMRAMELALTLRQNLNGIDNKQNLSAFSDFVTKKVHGNPIMDKTLLPTAKMLNIVKGAFSTMALGFNTSSFVRELFQNGMVGLTRAGVEKIPGVNAGSFAKAYAYVAKHAATNVKVASLTRQLNMTYGMANATLREMASQSRIRFLGLRNWDSSTAYLSTTMPDFQNRMTILVAKMMSDDCLDAHSLNEEGELVYDWKKDGRFKNYFAGEASGNKNSKEYREERAMYLAMLDEWNKNGKSLTEGDALPRAYTPKESFRLKNWADILYGHFDTESRAMVNDSFIGSMQMQYRTYATSKMEQWFIKAGSYNMESLKVQKDAESGETIYETIRQNKENGLKQRVLVKESDVTQEDFNNGAKPYVAWEGDPLEGMFHSAVKLGTAIVTMDQEKLNAIWKDPFEKNQLILALIDMLFFGVVGYAITMLFFDGQSADEIRHADWATQWAYKATVGATTDGPVWNTLEGFFGDMNPPMVGQIKTLWSSSMKVAHGDSSFLNFVSTNVGSLRELRGVAEGLL